MLELTLKLNKERYTAGEPIDGSLTLRNAGGEPVQVNGRLALNTPYSPEEFREVALMLTDPGGKPLDFQLKVNIGAPEDGDFRILKPGEAIELSYDLARYFDLKKPGAYSVQAAYQNQSEPGKANGIGTWKGEITSPVARFTLL